MGRVVAVGYNYRHTSEHILGKGWVRPMRTEDKIKQRLQKLLNQAADREGTPEGDAFYARAFELMAQYGYDERDLGNPDAGDALGKREYDFRGAYTDMQATLLHAISGALHCTGFTQRVYNSTRVKDAVIFGLERHLDRVDLLYALLLPVMLAESQKIRATSFAESTVVMRRSFMEGFASSIAARLTKAENNAGQEDGEYALVLIDDAAKAEQARAKFVEEQGYILSPHATNRSFDPDAYLSGHAAGENSDLGQTRVQARPALPF